MSVTLKLADTDAALVARILGRVHTLVESQSKDTESVSKLKALNVLCGPNLSTIKELEGTFEVVVRANRR